MFIHTLIENIFEQTWYLLNQFHWKEKINDRDQDLLATLDNSTVVFF